MGFATVASATDFSDADSITYGEAVDVLSAIGVINGYSDGSFKPAGAVTRAQMAKMVAFIMNEGEDVGELYAAANIFSDCTSHWAKGYIAYASNVELVAGVGAGKFNPDGSVTAVQAAKMLLCALGRDASIETYTGTTWAANVIDDAKAAKLFEGFPKGFDYNKALTREEAAQMMFNALNAKTGEYEDGKGTSITIGDAVINTGAGKWVESAKLYEVKFGKESDSAEELKYAGTKITDGMGRPAHEWSYGDWTGTYADEAAYTVENAIALEDLVEDLEDEDLAFATEITYMVNGKTAEIVTGEKGKEVFGANGGAYELYDTVDDAKDEITLVVGVAAKLDTVEKVQADKKTVEGDDRYISLKDVKQKIVADDEVNKKGAELANFEDLFANLEEGDAVLVVTDKTDTIVSVEIPEIIEAKITDVDGDEIVAGGETYLLATEKTPEVGADAQKLTVGANGVVYKVDGVDSDEDEVIVYLDAIRSESSKWGATLYAQMVTTDGKIIEGALATKNDDDKEVNKDLTTATESGFYAMDTNSDGEYILSAPKAAPTEITKSMTADDVKVVDTNKYFADGISFIYVEGTQDELAVSVKAGAQKVTLGENIETEAYYIYNTDDAEVTCVFVIGEYEAGAVEGEDLIYVASTESKGTTLDKEDKKATKYAYYVDGAEEIAMISNMSKVGFYTYEIDEASGVYKLVDAESSNKVNLTVGSDFKIEKDKYVSFDAVVDMVMASDAEIYDLSDNGMDSLADIHDIAEEGELDVTVSFVYDTEDNVITLMYVDAEEKAAE